MNDGDDLLCVHNETPRSSGTESPPCHDKLQGIQRNGNAARPAYALSSVGAVRRANRTCIKIFRRAQLELLQGILSKANKSDEG